MALDVRRRNNLVLLSLLTVVVGMMGLAFASAPLYRAFCRVTGFDGTTQKAARLPDKILNRTITIRFNADVHPGLPWSFSPHDKEVVVKLGQQGLTSYAAKNRSDKAMSGVAVYNVTPEKTGIYFNKIQCFCFAEQTLAPHQAVDMPVLFFVDPALAKDPDMGDVDTITLSYTFFQAKSSALEKRLISDSNSQKD